MHTVCELQCFQRDAIDSGMTDKEVDDLVTFLARNPTAGDEMPGTGGCRKVRVAGRGKGKSGGYRTITFYSGEKMPVFLMAVFAKGDKVNLTKKERNDLAKSAGLLVAEYRDRIVMVRAG